MNKIKTRHITDAMIRVVRFVAEHYNCCTMDIVRNEWNGRGHSASYARVHRVRHQGLIVRNSMEGSNRDRWVCTDKGISLLAELGM